MSIAVAELVSFKVAEERRNGTDLRTGSPQ